MELYTLTLGGKQARALAATLEFMDGNWQDDADILDKLGMTPCEWGELKDRVTGVARVADEREPA